MTEHDETRHSVLRHLRELVDSLDRRLPQILNVNEPDISKASAELRAKAIAMIVQLEAADPESEYDTRTDRSSE